MTSRMFLKHYNHTIDKDDSITVEDSLILHGKAITVPPGERKVLEQIHQEHLGTSKCQYRAR